MEIRKGRHVVHLLHVHLVFVTKRRGKVFTKEHLGYIRYVFEKICSDFGADVKEFNGEADHVHLLVTYPPKVRISELVNSLKGVSSRQLKQRFPDIRQFWSVSKSRGVVWSPSYSAASCGGAPISVLKQYIEQQGLGAATSPG